MTWCTCLERDKYLRIHGALHNFQSKFSWLFFISSKLIDVIWWLIVCNVDLEGHLDRVIVSSSSVDRELFVSLCTKLLTPGKKETLLETFVFRHAFFKKKETLWASLAARNRSCSRKPNNYISNFSADSPLLLLCNIAICFYSTRVQTSQHESREEFDQDLLSLEG